jgi:hypothetical protein
MLIYVYVCELKGFLGKDSFIFPSSAHFHIYLRFLSILLLTSFIGENVQRTEYYVHLDKIPTDFSEYFLHRDE